MIKHGKILDADTLNLNDARYSTAVTVLVGIRTEDRANEGDVSSCVFPVSASFPRKRESRACRVQCVGR